jgi:site-specific recombinase XerC
MNSLATYSDLSPLDRATLADGTRRNYKTAILLLIASNVNVRDYQALADYALSLSHSGRANLKAALAILTRDAVNQAKTSNASIEDIQRFLWQMEALDDAIRVHRPTTLRTPHWLSQDQVDTITGAALDNSLRDYIVMSLLLGAGLRREELETLTFDAMSQVPDENGNMVDILTVIGKGEHKRTIPLAAVLANNLRRWKAIVGEGRIARRMYKGGKIGASLTAPRIFAMVRKYGLYVGIKDLDPHDCRRSYGRLMYFSNKKDIMKVMVLLGHKSVETTQIYIGVKISIDLDSTPLGALQVAGD